MKFLNQEKGFTLIELMVSVAVFSVVMLVAISTLLSIVDANKKAQALKSVMNNLNFALESMSREIRVGTNYHCEESPAGPYDPLDLAIPQDCGVGGGQLLALESSDGDFTDNDDQLVYRLNSSVSGGSIERSLDAGATWTAITAPEVNISEFTFYVTGTETYFPALSNTQQPRVTMSIQGVAGAGNASTTFTVQATVSQRLLDF